MRTLTAIALLAVALVLGAPLAAQSEPGPIDIVDVRGPIDRYAAEFVISALEKAEADGAQAVILQIDSPGAVDRSILDAISAVQRSPVPVIAWVGDAPATARGGALELAAATSYLVAAPGSELGMASPIVVGTDLPGSTGLEDPVIVTEAGGIVDAVEPALGPLIVGLDGLTFDTADGPVVLETAISTVDDDGNSVLQVAPQVRFEEASLFARFMRLALAPEALFFFLVAGLSFAAFEFYALGPGIAAATAAVPLFLAGYGLVVYPLGWGLAVVLLAMWLLVSDYQRGGFGLLSYAASVLLMVGGFFVVDARPQISPNPAAVVVIALGVALFFMFAMPTVARARFTTQTMGRQYLIGREGVAVSEVVDGAVTVEVDGARWRATTFREAPIEPGGPVVVTGLQGLYLEVDAPGRENKETDQE